jgi:diguanylate cyclase (GGDEF)-like protein
MQRSQRYGSPLSAVVFDIDDFKEINDRFGHLAGDAVLAELSKMLRAGVRSIDSVGRLGGEEFLVVLPETDGHAATLIGDRLRQSLSNHIFRCDDNEITVSISGGVGCLRDNKDVEGLIGMADENLYRAKREGKNMVYYGEDR